MNNIYLDFWGLTRVFLYSASNSSVLPSIFLAKSGLYPTIYSITDIITLYIGNFDYKNLLWEIIESKNQNINHAIEHVKW